jgi:hypothetical protein
MSGGQPPYPPGRGDAKTSQEIGTIKYPVDPADWFAIRRSDWKRIRGRVEGLTNPLPYLGQVGWACVGIGSTALLGLLPWAAAYSQLSASAHGHYAWITPFLASLGVAALVVAVLCFIANREIRAHDQVTVTSALSDMDVVYQQQDQEDARLVNEQLQEDRVSAIFAALELALTFDPSGKILPPETGERT